MMVWLKYIVIVILRFLLRGLYVFPVRRKRILFEASEGEIFGCNPKYIFMFLHEKYGDCLDYVWCLNDRAKLPQTYRLKCVKYLSFKHIFYLITSKVIITNVGIEPFFPKRKSQLVINTWHGGGAYKDSGAGSAFLSKSRVNLMNYMLGLRAGMTNYFVSSCEVWNPIYSKKFLINEERILKVGLPRNDIFFKENNLDEIRAVLGERYGIDGREMWVLYAPTFRGYWRNVNHTPIPFDTIMVKDAIRKRFGKGCEILYRHHNFDKGRRIEGCIDVSDYQDMQELLVAADVLITDYSSSIWDYSFTNKPGFLYVPDLKDYEHDTRFLTPLSEWQYPYATNMNDLCDLIEKYDEEIALARIKQHLVRMGSYENGHATEKVCKVIEEWVRNG